MKKLKARKTSYYNSVYILHHNLKYIKVYMKPILLIWPASLIISVSIALIALHTSCNHTISNKEHNEVRLGKLLFYSRALSANNTKSCASCHDPKYAFTDGYKRSIGVYGDLHQRNSKPLFNLQQQHYFTAGDSTIHSILTQMDRPLYNQHPPELGLLQGSTHTIMHIQQDTAISKAYTQLYHKPITSLTMSQVKQAIATYILTLTSYNTRYDAYIQGHTTALDSNEKAGLALYNSTITNCASCHGGSNFNTPTVHNKYGNTLYYFNTGLYNVDGAGSYPITDQGLYNTTKQPKDKGAFAVPTLRNLYYTAPYYHDGSASTLSQVIHNYNLGGRNITQGLHAGNGVASPYKHASIKPLGLSVQDEANLVAFLLTLTDSTIVSK